MDLNCCNILKRVFATFFTVLALNMAQAQVPTANFTASPVAGCSPLVVQFEDLSTGSPTAWNWNFGNGATSSQRNPATTYFNPGNYTITLTVTNANGSNTLTRSQYITVYENPTVNFNTNNTAGCFPLRVQFTDISTAGVGNTNVAWFWDLGNGTQSNQQHPFITYTTAGNFTVTLKVTNDKGCSGVRSVPNLIQVTQGVSSDFTSTQPTVCRAPASISFTNSSTGPGSLSYVWDFGDGNTSTQQNPTHIYTNPGTYNVTLITTSSSGCVDTLVRQNHIAIGGIVTDFNSADSVCVNSVADFQNTSSPVPLSSTWNFGDGASSVSLNASHIYTTPGVYSIRLINNYGYCTDSTFRNITVSPRPNANFSAPVTTRCQPPLTVNFQDLSANAVSWQWDFGDGNTSTQQNPTHTYNNYGNFNVTLVVTNTSGCTDTLRRNSFVRIRRPQITIPNLPVRGCVPYTINPVPSVNTLDNVTSWTWHFGDGTTSTVQNPSHTYVNQGTYTVKLVITTSTGCTDSLVIGGAVQVGTHPVVDFSANPTDVCAFQEIQFTDLSVPSDQWMWIFGDGGSSNMENPLYEYSDTGYFNVTLHVWNNGCEDSLTKPNYIHIKPPIASYTFATVCANKLQFNFTDNSIDATTWFWDFGDGTTSNVPSPTHTFPALGNYNVTLTVTNDTCSHSQTQLVRVIDEAPDFISPSPTVCRGNPTVLNVTNIASGNIVSYEWDFGNGTQQTTSTPSVSFTYPASGSYTIRLLITDVNGCRDSIVKTNYIRVNGPVADFDAVNTSGCRGLLTTFNDLSATDGVNALVSWKFDFGDGVEQTFNAPPFTHVYQDAGLFSVELIVTDASGCSDSMLIANLVATSDPAPNFSSRDTLTCPGATVRFTNQSVGTTLTFSWDFGDGGTSTAVAPTHVYNNTGLYTVSLALLDSFGCRDTLTKYQFIRVDRPVASFTVNDSVSSCTPFEVIFTNTSQYFIASHWDFGVGTSTLTNPISFYSIPGIYNVQLVVRSRGGCTDTARKTITVYDTAGARIDYVPFNGCKPLLVNLNATATGVYTFLWDYGDGIIDTTAGPVMSHVYNTFGDYIPKVILEDPAGCLIPVTGQDTIRIRGATAKFGVDQTLLCDSGYVSFTDSTTYNENVLQYLWDFGDGNISDVQNPVHVYTSPGLYNVSLTVRTQSGCRDTLRKPALVKVVQSPSIAVGGDSIACVFDPMIHTGLFNRIDTSAVAWTWQFPNGNSSTAQNPPIQVYNTAGNYNIVTIVTNSSGCMDTVVKPIIINPLPTVSMPGLMTMQVGFPIVIPAIYTSNVTNYLWTPSTYLNCATCPQPVVNASFNTEYIVSFVDSNGCRNIGTIEIVVFCKNANVFLPNTFSPNSDGSNDVFYARGRGLDRIKLLRVFNRWGEVVFEKQNFPVNDPLAGWDGTFKGQKLQADVYVYQVEIYCANGELIRFNGNIALIK